MKNSGKFENSMRAVTINSELSLPGLILLLEILKYGTSNFSVLSPFPSLTALPTLHYDNLNIALMCDCNCMHAKKEFAIRRGS